MDIRFDIAKKLTKPLPKARGITLRSLRTSEDGSASAILMAESYGNLRESVESYRMLTGASLACRSKGRSLEVYSEGKDGALVLMDFLKSVSFNSEDVLETVEFFDLCLGKDAESGITVLAVDISMEDVRISCSKELADGEDPEDFYAGIAPVLDRFDMGIIKE